MLGYLKGKIQERDGNEMILAVGTENQGFIGYAIKSPDHPRYDAMIPGHQAEVYIYSHIREDAFDLYGFINTEEKKLFMTLMSVSGVGPKLALTLLSHTEANSLIQMILDEDKEALTSISGVGKKTAERMILELKEPLQKKVEAKIFNLNSSRPAGATVDRGNSLFIESYLALQGLGYREAQAKIMTEKALSDINLNPQQPNSKANVSVEDVIRVALRKTI
jgi:Holliday junction DNA helicase RuvA